MPSPGMLERHYSPRAPLTVYDSDERGFVARLVRDAAAAIAEGQRVGIMAAEEDRAALIEIEQLGSRAIVVYWVPSATSAASRRACMHRCASSMPPASIGSSPAAFRATTALPRPCGIACAAPGSERGQNGVRPRNRRTQGFECELHRGLTPF